MERDFGTIAASSVPSKSVFSIARLQIAKRRNRLAPKTIGMIMCLRSWGLVPEGKEEDGDDVETDEDDIRKERGFGRTELVDVEGDSQVI
jgi:hypothetical protein